MIGCREPQSSENAQLRRELILAVKRTRRTPLAKPGSTLQRTEAQLASGPISADELQAVVARLLQSTAAATQERTGDLKALRVLVSSGAWHSSFQKGASLSASKFTDQCCHCPGDPWLPPASQRAEHEEPHSVCWHLLRMQVLPALLQALNPKYAPLPPATLKLPKLRASASLKCMSTSRSNDHDCILEAAWCLTNMAAAEHEVARAIMGAAPLLIALLGGGWGARIAGQSAWALGMRDCSHCILHA